MKNDLTSGLETVGRNFVEFCDTYSRFFIVQGRKSVAYARQCLGGLLSDILDKNIERIEEKFADFDYESI